MRLVLIKPRAIRHQMSTLTTAMDFEAITSWLKQWTVPNNYKQVVLDLDEENKDCFILYAEEFLRTYRHVFREPHAKVVDEFTFEFRVLLFETGEMFWTQDGRPLELTVRQMQEGLASCLEKFKKLSPKKGA